MLEDEKVPRDNEFKFKQRADVLVKKWQLILNASKSNGTSLGNATSSVISPGSISIVSGLARDGSSVKSAHGEVIDMTSVAQSTAAIDLNGKGEGVVTFALVSTLHVWLVPNGVSLGVAPPASSGVATHLPPAPIPMSIDPSAFSTQDTPMEEGA